MPSLCLKNGKRRWRGAVMVAGKMVRKWFPDATKDSERAAASWEADEKRRLKEQEETKIPSGSWTVLRWANEELRFVQERRSPATLRERKTAFRMLVQSVGPDFPLDQLDYDVAEEHLDNQESSRSGNAANKDRKNLASSWKWAQRKFRRDGFPLGVNPWVEVERYAETRHPRYVPPMSDMLAVLDSVQGQELGGGHGATAQAIREFGSSESIQGLNLENCEGSDFRFYLRRTSECIAKPGVLSFSKRGTRVTRRVPGTRKGK